MLRIYHEVAPLEGSIFKCLIKANINMSYEDPLQFKLQQISTDKLPRKTITFKKKMVRPNKTSPTTLVSDSWKAPQV